MIDPVLHPISMARPDDDADSVEAEGEAEEEAGERHPEQELGGSRGLGERGAHVVRGG